MMQINVFVGYDSRWPMAYAVTVRSFLNKWDGRALDIQPLLLPHLIGSGLYNRDTTIKNGQMHDTISDAPMATEFAISRFLIPYLNNYKGWTLFCDSDFLFRENPQQLFDMIDERYAIMCVKHQYEPTETEKMNGQAQTQYPRKNWTSLMLINNAHIRNKFLGLSNCSHLPGRDLHALGWLHDSDIGALPPEWNWLEGHSSPKIEPKALHYTRGTPDMPGYENAPYADEWRAVAKSINMCRTIE